jgi:hypothetical protein
MSATPPTEIASIGQNALAAKRSVPPSGNSAHMTIPPASAGRASHSAGLSAGRPPPAASAAAPIST